MPLALLMRACVEGREATCRAASRVQHVHVHPAGLRKPFGAGRFIFEIQQCNRTQVVGVALARKLIDMGHHPDVRVILDTMKRHGILLGEADMPSLIRLHMASGDADSAESAQQLSL